MALISKLTLTLRTLSDAFLPAVLIGALGVCQLTTDGVGIFFGTLKFFSNSWKYRFTERMEGRRVWGMQFKILGWSS